MEGFGGLGFSSISNNIKRKRSSASRRPRNDTELFSNNADVLSLSSTPSSDNGSKVSSDENAGYGMSSWKKERNLNQCRLGASASNWKSVNKLTQSSEVQSNQLSSTSNSAELVVPSDGPGQENKLKKVKLKVGGVTRTIHAQATSECPFIDVSSSKKSQSSGFSQQQHKLILQDNLDDNCSPPLDKESGLHGVPWKDFSQNAFTARKSDFLTDKTLEGNVIVRQAGKLEAVRKSKRVPKRRILDGNFVEDDDDEEIRYLEKLRTSRVSVNYSVEEGADEEGSKKQQKMSRVMKMSFDGEDNIDVGDYGSTRSCNEGKRLRCMKAFEDTDYVEGEEFTSDGELTTKRKKMRKEFVDSLGDSKKELMVTTRQRALKTGKDLSSSFPCAVSSVTRQSMRRCSL